MRCAADRGRPGLLIRSGIWAAAAGCLVAACSAPAKPSSGASSASSPVSRGLTQVGGGGGPVVVYGSVGGGGGGPVVMIGGPGGGFVALPGGGGSGGGGSGGRPKITVGPIPPAYSNQVVNLPLGTYADVAFGQQTVLGEASTLLAQKCMASRGFVYSTQASPSQAETLVEQAEHPFGVTTDADASTYGYGRPTSSGPQAGPAFLGGFQFGNLLKQPRAWVVALLGFAPGARIGPHPAEGCLAEASNELYGGRGGLSDPVPQIAIQAATWTESDPRVEAVDSAWSRCMAARGYTKYSTPQQAADAHWPSKPTPTETATAEADVACKQAVNLDNTWLAVEAAYQSALIGQDLTTLASLQHSFGKMLDRAEALLSLPSLPTASLPRLPGQIHGSLTPVHVRPVG